MKFEELTKRFITTDLQTALRLAAERETRTFIKYEERLRLLVAVFNDGLEIAWQSECSGPYSEVTPDLDWEPPTVLIRNAKCLR